MQIRIRNALFDVILQDYFRPKRSKKIMTKIEVTRQFYYSASITCL